MPDTFVTHATPIPPSSDRLPARTAAVLDRCARLARETEEPGRITRRFLSEPMHRVHALVGGWMAEAGMTVRIDAAGNIIGRSAAPGTPDDAPVLLIGSHLDTVPDAGAYDGILGVLLGIAAVEALGGPGPTPIEVIGFSEEEGVRYRTPYLGSRALVGRFDPALLDLVDADGVAMADAFRRFGLDPSRVGQAAVAPGRIAAFVEVHIEQGPMLDGFGWPLGVVEAIAGQSRLTVTFEGRPGHAGTTPMHRRQDALAGAARWISAVEFHRQYAVDLVATVGLLTVKPGASNVIPGSVTMSLDVRDQDDETRRWVVSRLLRAGRTIARRRGLRFRVDRAQELPAVPMNAPLTESLITCVQSEGWPVYQQVSGAGHDAAILAEVAPATMLFIRSPGGISHHPDESVRVEDVAVALSTLVRFCLLWRP